MHEWELMATSNYGEVDCPRTSFLYQCDVCGKMKYKEVKGRFILNKEEDIIEDFFDGTDINRILYESD